MKKVTGIGGIFFKCQDPAAIRSWYQQHLGFDGSPYGTSFGSRNLDDPEKKETTTWSPFKVDTDHFEPSKKEFMINYKVDNLVDLLAELKASGVEIVGEIQDFPPYGKFAHIMDPEGNKIELWEALPDE